MTKLFYQKLIGTLFKDITEDWKPSWLRYMIDSKYRVTKRVDRWMQEQIDNSSLNVVLLAKKLKKNNPDDTIINILKWVHKNIKYKTDYSNYKSVEHWGTPDETLNRKAEDCDSQAALIYVLAHYADISPLQLYNCIGTVYINGKSVGHYWLCYYSLKHNKLVYIDSTYYPNLRPIKDRPAFRISSRKYTKVWYIFNQAICARPNDD